MPHTSRSEPSYSPSIPVFPPVRSPWFPRTIFGRSMRASFMALVVLLAAVHALGQELGFLEDFVLAPDRFKALEQLVPGSDEHYFYLCLQSQHAEDFGRARKELDAWIQRHGRTDRARMIERRQALLTYSSQPNETIEFLKRELGLAFGHQPVRHSAGSGGISGPSLVDPAMFEISRLISEELAKRQSLDGFSVLGLQALDPSKLNAEQRRAWLNGMSDPTIPGIVDAVLEDLKRPDSSGFGSLEIHKRLLLDQLDECAKKQPALLDSPAFVAEYLHRLQPSADSPWERDVAERKAYLERLAAFAAKLPPVHQSLKAHVLYHQLQLGRSQGDWDQTKFLEYIQLPRQSHYIAATIRDNPRAMRFAADLNWNSPAETLLPPIGDDEPLVRDYLIHFLTAAEDDAAFRPWIDADYLRRVFAEAKLTGADSDADLKRAFTLLGPDQIIALRDRVDLELAPTNPARFRADDPVELDVWIKHVPALTIKIYELQAESYFRRTRQPLGGDIDLDGLLPNHERTESYEEGPFRRKLRHFSFPELAGPGIYVIDFVGNGRSSRAVIQKGTLHFHVESTAEGQRFTVADEAGNLVKDATVWMEGAEYRSQDDSGRILVPFSTQPGDRPIVVSHGRIAVLGTFQHQAEVYALGCGMLLDREALLAGKTAEIVLHPQLRLNRLIVPLAALESLKIEVSGTNQAGIETPLLPSTSLDPTDIHMSVRFPVPADLVQCSAKVQGTLKLLSTGTTVPLEANANWSFNEVQATSQIGTPHLLRGKDGFVLEFLGRNGEPIANHPATIKFSHAWLNNPLDVAVRTDARGRVALGPLPHVSSLSVEFANSTPREWRLDDVYASVPHAMAVEAREEIRLPFAGEDVPDSQGVRRVCTLLELRHGAPTRDHTGRITIMDGEVRIPGLEAGDYVLKFHRPEPQDLPAADFPPEEFFFQSSVQIHVFSGRTAGAILLGGARLGTSHGNGWPALRDTRLTDQSLRVEVVNADPLTRVHVFATRYVPAFAPYDELHHALHAFLPESGDPTPRVASRTWYLNSRSLGDELRYVLDRRLATKFPGTLLTRPSLLLNPWKIQDTRMDVQTLAEGENFAPTEPPAAPVPAAGGRLGMKGGAGGFGGGGLGGGAFGDEIMELTDFASLEFLRTPSVLLSDRQPNAQGIIEIPLKELGDGQHVHVVLASPWTMSYRALVRDEVPLATREQRLVKSLDPKKPLAKRRGATSLTTGGVLKIADITTSDLQLYESLPDVFEYFRTKSGDPVLAEFEFVTRWPRLTEAEKREEYGKHACHELNFFLARKDPEFFARVVRPYVRNKFEPTFLDDWLVDRELDAFQSTHAFGRLNIAERILLGSRIPDRFPGIRRHVHELQALLPKNVAADRLLLGQVLLGKALATREAGAEEMDEAAKFRDMKDQLGERGGGPDGLMAGAPSDATAGEELKMSLSRSEMDAENPSDNSSKEKLSRERRLMDEVRRAKQSQAEYRQLFRQVESTKEWGENNYDQLAWSLHNAERIPVGPFWVAWADHLDRMTTEGKSSLEFPFIAPEFRHAYRNFSEMMFALALLDLPFEPAKHTSVYDGPSLTLTAGSPLVAFHQTIEEVPVSDNPPMLVREEFFDASDRFVTVDGTQRPKPVAEFLINRVYGCQVAMTNASSTPLATEVLVQVPQGAILLGGAEPTRGVPLDFQPYQTQTLEYTFYFPAAGKFPHYPAHVAADNQLVGRTDATVFEVLAAPTRSDPKSWEHISQEGTAEEVLAFLDGNNVQALDLSLIAFRMRDADFFQRTIELLRARNIFHPVLWSYGFEHADRPTMSEFLRERAEFVAGCGPRIVSPLLTFTSHEDGGYEHLEYLPLVNPRAHRVGGRRRILNDKLFEQYQRLLTSLAMAPRPTSQEQLALVYYLLVQDRLEEGIARFALIDPKEVESEHVPAKIQYDYLRAYLACRQGDLLAARPLAAAYLDYPVARWRTAFQEIAELVAVYEKGKSADVAENGTALSVEQAEREPALEIRMVGDQLRLDYRHLQEAVVHFHPVDLELLFSRNPFVSEGAAEVTSVRAIESRRVDLPAAQDHVDVEIPANLRGTNLCLEVVGGGKSRTLSYYANSLAVQIRESSGQLEVRDATTRKPLSTVYVKVYARRADNSIAFHKDGYTDPLGRFDYASVSAATSANSDAPAVRFAILVASESQGAVVREADPPQE